MRRYGFAAALAAVTAIATGCAAPPAPVAGAQTTPTVTAETLAALADCPELPSLPTARCGLITVPRDRTRPAAGTIDVGFALVPHTDVSRPGLGTIVPNPGGPGSSTIDLTGRYFTDALAPTLDRHDVLLIDPRGVGRSTALSCPALDGPERVYAPPARQREMIGECGAQLGDRVADYATNAVADDIDTVRATLGLDRLDLLGVSYGSYLMPAYAHRYPDHVRTVTMAGAYAVNEDTTGAVGAAAFRRAVGLVCLSTRRCDGGAVLADLAALATRLRHTPETLQIDATHRVTLDDWQLASVAGRLYSNRPDTTKQLALATAAAAARDGDLTPIRDLATQSILAEVEIYSYGPLALSDAQSWATTCHDYLRDFDYADPVAQRTADYEAVLAAQPDADFAPFTAEAWSTRANYDTGACLHWPNDPTAGSPFAPGAALPDVPVLVLSGDLDANTPSDSGRAAAAQFPHATFVEIAGAGHTPASTAEGAEAIIRFINDHR
ncbi:alpha/beta hydrolase [Catenuloplanes japonicus]|uniref:alpha/beta hydrolase n=1 Tax=Catenuloplanes japonicus TaxID=33876 RepID=UPI000527C253|nr:alpha/beta fold hydrolase [Catenuloplanes japonicus]